MRVHPAPDIEPAARTARTSRSAADAPHRVLIADDHAAVRAGLRLILESATDITVVAEAANGEEAVEAARELDPDVILMDLRMPGVNGEEATRRLSRSGFRVLVLTTFDDDEAVFGAIRAGAKGFVLKSTDGESLLSAVRQIADGAGALDPALTDRVFSAFRRRGARTAPGSTAASGRRTRLTVNGIALTEREWQVLVEIGAGHSNAVISERLGIRQGTVKSHITRLLAKLGLRSRVQAALFARESGVTGQSPPE